MPCRPLMVCGALLRRSCDGIAAATESLLRRSRCCDGAAQTSSVALILRFASATELMLLRACDGADAAATELMLRAALLRLSCEGVAAATELRRSRCCEGAAHTSSVALKLRVASRRDAQNETSIHFPPCFPPCCSNFKIGWPLTIMGHIRIYKHAPPAFWRKRRQLY